MKPEVLAAVLLAFLAAGAIKGIAGMGLPALAMALLGLLMPPVQAAALMVWPVVLSNVVQCTGPHWRKLFKLLWPMWAGLALFTWATPLPDLREAGNGARMGLGLVLMAYGAWGLLKPDLPDWRERALPVGAAVGATTGVLAATTGVFSMPLGPFLQTLRLEREEMVQALGISFMFGILALMVRLGLASPVSAGIGVWPVVGAVAATFAGVGIGYRFRQRISIAQFQRLLFAVFLGLGVLMLIRASMG